MAINELLGRLSTTYTVRYKKPGAVSRSGRMYQAYLTNSVLAYSVNSKIIPLRSELISGQ
jgi:hypothetical protein